MKMPKKKFAEEADLGEPVSVEETPVADVPVKKGRKPKVDRVTVSEEDFLSTLTAAGGTAKLGALFKAFDVSKYPNVVASKLKTAIRIKGIQLAKEGKVEAIHVDNKRSYTFKTVA